MREELRQAPQEPKLLAGGGDDLWRRISVVWQSVVDDLLRDAPATHLRFHFAEPRHGQRSRELCNLRTRLHGAELLRLEVAGQRQLLGTGQLSRSARRGCRWRPLLLLRPRGNDDEPRARVHRPLLAPEGADADRGPLHARLRLDRLRIVQLGFHRRSPRAVRPAAGVPVGYTEEPSRGGSHMHVLREQASRGARHGLEGGRPGRRG
mmetsp:Transcript_71/g.212  ORF Transcript_71/g.212 Transcript_71/m.212 type:complete len:207 (+) Transcript_71:543-1163(+)